MPHLRTWLFGLSIVLFATSIHALPARAERPSFYKTPVAFSIPAGNLDEALQKWAAIADLKLLVATEAVADQTTSGIAGTLTPEAALQQLLSSTKLHYGVSGARSITVYDPDSIYSARAQTNLPDIRVGRARPRVVVPAPASPPPSAPQKPQETAYGPVDGYVATRSATGTKTDTAIIDTPQSVSVVTRDQMDSQQVDSAKDALRYTAGVVAESRGNFSGYDIIYNRGFIVDRYLDGLRLQGNTGFVTPQVELWGMERVELLRGPSSVLFGQGSPGGLVNMVSKRPTDRPFGEINLQGGSFDRFQGAFDIGGPADANQQFLYRLNGLLRDADNQVNFVKEKREYIAPSFTWRPNSDTSLTVLLNYQKDPDVGLYSFVPYRGSIAYNPKGVIPTSFYAGDPNFNKIDRTQQSVGTIFEHKFDSVFTFRQNLRYQDTRGSLNQVLPYALLADNSTLVRYSQATNESIYNFGLDNQLQAKFTTGILDHTVLAGLDYQHTTFNQFLAQGFTKTLNIFNPNYFQSIAYPTLIQSQTRQVQNQTGIYAQDQIKIGGLTVVAGGRRDHAANSTKELFTESATVQDDYASTGRLGAVYRFDNGLAPYAVIATSFNPSTGTDFASKPFKPTTGQMKEAGIRYEPPGWKAMLTASVYEIVQENVLTPDPSHLGFLTQTGEITSRGFEIEQKLSVTDRLDLIASYTYIDAKVTQSNDVDFGKVPLWIPKNMAAGWADYTFREGWLNGFGLAYGIRYVGETFGNAANTIVIPAYTVSDAAIHYDLEALDRSLKGFRLAVNATNIFDKQYVSECTNENCLYAPRRRILGTLKYKW